MLRPSHPSVQQQHVTNIYQLCTLPPLLQMWTPKKKEWQEADLGSHTAQQGLKPTNFEFLASGSACQSTIHADVHGWLGASCDGA